MTDYTTPAYVQNDGTIIRHWIVALEGDKPGGPPGSTCFVEESNILYTRSTGNTWDAPGQGGHNHDASYSATTHNHDGFYSATDHTHPGGSEAFPVGSVFIAAVATNPATLLGYGTWSAFGAGRVLVGVDSGDADFDTVEETGGAKTTTLTESQIPSHTHTQNSHNHTQDAHAHGLQRYPTTTGASSGFTADTSMSGTPTAVTLPMANATATNQAATATNQNTGGGAAHTNVQPYIVVHMWKRTA